MWINLYDDVSHEVKLDLIQEKKKFFFRFSCEYVCTMMSVTKLNKI